MRLKPLGVLQQRQAQVARDRKAQVYQIGAEDFGVVEWDVEGCKEVEGQGILVGVVEDQVEEEEEEVAAPILIH